MVTKEHILQAKRDINQILDDLLSNFEVEPYAVITDAYWKSKGIINIDVDTNIDVDIKYWFGDTAHYVEDYIDKIHQEDGTFSFSIGVNESDKDWNVQAVGEEESNIANVGPYVKNKVLVGIHDKADFDSDFSILRTYDLDEARKAHANGQFVYLTFTHRWKKDGQKESREKWKRKIEGWMSDSIKTFDPKKCVVEIQDEPLSHHHMRDDGFTSDDIHFLYNTFKNANPEYKFGFSHTRGELNRHDENPLPKSDFIASPFYPFKQNEDLSEEGFREFIEKQVEQIRGINPDADIYAIGQGFYNDNADTQDWCRPPLWAPEEYKNVLSQLGVKAILYWSIDREGSTVGMNEMADYLEEVKKSV